MDVKEIIAVEEQYKDLLIKKLKGDKRLLITSPEAKYPEPVYVYIKCIKTGKTIAVRLDGVDKTMRFWDYVDDDYSEEDGVWSRMTSNGIEDFVKKLHIVMEKAVDIEYYDEDGECEEYYSGVATYEFTPQNAQKVVKKHGKDVNFAIASYTSFFGDIQYVFDRNLRQIIKK